MRYSRQYFVWKPKRCDEGHNDSLTFAIWCGHATKMEVNMVAQVILFADVNCAGNQAHMFVRVESFIMLV